MSDHAFQREKCADEEEDVWRRILLQQTHSEKVKALVQLVYEATSERTFENVCLVVQHHVHPDDLEPH